MNRLITSTGHAFRTLNAASFACWKVFLSIWRYRYLAHPQYYRYQRLILKQILRIRKNTISIGFSSQWNLGRKIHSWPASRITVSSTEIWLTKSSCLLRRRAMQQLSFSKGQTGEHLARRCRTLNPRSSRVCCSPFGLWALWLITKTDNVAFEFLLRRHFREFVGIENENSTFYCERTARWKISKRGEHAPVIQKKRLHTFSDFSRFFRGFAKF